MIDIAKWGYFCNHRCAGPGMRDFLKKQLLQTETGALLSVRFQIIWGRVYHKGKLKILSGKGDS